MVGNVIHTMENPANNLIKFLFEWLEAVSQAIVFVVFALAFIFRIVNIDGWSMLHTLRDQDKVFVCKFSYIPKRNDVVVIAKGPHLNVPIIKRVIAVEGDSLEVDYATGNVIVNGEVLDEPYIAERMVRKPKAEIPKIIPQDHVFVMGDDRNYSTDSNDFGAISVKYVIGKASYIIFPFYRIGRIR
ncbi:signal peptidase I [Clostridia bacterium]|nr:signal peptidase I [Clostridia bacterium]